MMTGPTQPEMGRERVADAIRQARAEGRATTFARVRRDRRRARIGGMFQALATSIRPRPAEVPQPIRPATVDGC